MLFNRETDYAVRVLKNLSTDRPTSISSFVEGEFISEAIAYKVSRKLDKAGIIYGVRGEQWWLCAEQTADGDYPV